VNSVTPVNRSFHSRRIPDMRFDVFFTDRVGIAQEILATLTMARHG
jgi:hypothetical protein